MAAPATIAPPRSLTVVSPEGTLGTMDSAEFTPEVQAQGFRLAQPQEVQEAQLQEQYGEGLGNAATAFGEGALGSLTGGLLPTLGDKVGALERMQRNPIAHGAGAVAGVVVPLALSGGADAPAASGALGAVRGAADLTAPALISRVGRAVSGGVEGAALPGLVGKMLPAMAGAAAEGAMYGGTDVVERHVLGDPGLTAEKAIAEIGLSAIVPSLLAGGGKLVGAALEPLGDRLIAKGAAAADAKAFAEAEKQAASLEAVARERTANAYRQMERIELALQNPALPTADREAMLAFKASPEYADLVKANAASIMRQAPEALAEREGAKGVLGQFQADRPGMMAARAAELQEPARLGQLVNERVIQRYGSRAVLGQIFGAATGAAPGVGPLVGISFGYMKDVLKRIARDPAMYSTLGNFLKTPIQTLSAMTGLAHLVGSTDKAIASGVGAIFRGETAAAGSEVAGSAVNAGNFTNVSNGVTGLANNLDRLAQETSGQTNSLQPHAPGTSDAIHGVAARGVQLLASKLPAPGSRRPLDPPYRPSPAELAVFNRYQALAEHPTLILQHVANGTLTQDQLNTVQAVYPKLLAEMRAQVTSQLAKEMAKGTRIPYRTRLSLSHFLGTDLDSTTTQVHLAANRAAFQRSPAPPGGGGGKPTAKGLGSLNQASRLDTPQQASTRRGM